MNIWKIIYLNCGERYEVMIDHRVYTRNLSSCEIKAWEIFRVERDTNPWPLLCRCSAQYQTQLSSQLGAGNIVVRFCFQKSWNFQSNYSHCGVLSFSIISAYFICSFIGLSKRYEKIHIGFFVRVAWPFPCLWNQRINILLSQPVPDCFNS